jgi:polar amino acid transport system substrate-binding protein
MINNKHTVALTLILGTIAGAAAGFLTAYTRGRNAQSGQAEHVSAVYEKVLKTNKIRAGFVSYPPGSIVDPRTKEVTGVFPDLLRHIAKNTGLDVEFAEEVGWATLIEGLETGRFDIIGGVWANPNRGKMATLSEAVFFSGVGVWVRPDEKRFSPDGNWLSLNSKEVRIGAIDGSTPLNIVKAQFPLASLVTYPNLTTESQLFLDLVGKKIDIFFAEPAQGLLFQRSNPGTIRNIATDRPIRVFGHVFLMKRGEFQFKNMIDTAINDLQGSGVVDELLDKYEPAPGAFYRRANQHVIPSTHTAIKGTAP